MKSETRIALVPGASRPLGRAIAKKFAENGITVIIPFFSDWPESTREMECEFDSLGYDYVAFPCDLTSSDDTDALATEIKSRFGKLNYLVNNIERGGMPVVHGSYTKDVNRNQWELEFNTTLKAKWNLFNSAYPLMKDCGDSAVTNISSISANTGRTGPASYIFNDGYSAANKGVELLTRTWARQAAPSVRVNEIMIGLIRGRHAEETRGWSLLTERQQKDLTNHILLKRTGFPAEIADMVFFISTQALYVTGSVITVDGGYCLGGEPVNEMPVGIL